MARELCHCRRQRAWLLQISASSHALFPALPSDGQFFCRATTVQDPLRRLRQAVHFWAGADLEPQRLLDSFPLPLRACDRIRPSRLPISRATFGYSTAKKQYFHRLRPQLLLTCSGFIDDLIPVPDNCNDALALGFYFDEAIELGRESTGQVWELDNGCSNPQIERRAMERLGLTLCVRQQDRRGESPSSWRQTLDWVCKPIEGMIAMLTECMRIEHLLVRTDQGLYRRLQAKATAVSLACYFNRILGVDPLDLARCAV